MFENRRCPGKRAHLGERMRNGPASTCVASGGASFVTMVKTADLRDRDHSAQLRGMHFPWFRRALVQRQVRTYRVIVDIERLIGSIRRECLDHVIVCNETSPRRILTAYT